MERLKVAREEAVRLRHAGWVAAEADTLVVVQAGWFRLGWGPGLT